MEYRLSSGEPAYVCVASLPSCFLNSWDLRPLLLWKENGYFLVRGEQDLQEAGSDWVSSFQLHAWLSPTLSYKGRKNNENKLLDFYRSKQPASSYQEW